MRCLVVYHSRTGTSRKIATHAANRLSADMVEIQSSKYGLGLVNYLRAGYDSVFDKLPAIDAANTALGAYDLVLMVAPVWAGRASTPLRAYLKSARGIKRAAAVLTCGGHAPQSAFDELSALAGVPLERTFILRDRDVWNSDLLPPAIDQYLGKARDRLAA
jgi:menaquinone-dependent protoporphyrinogen IX oxidase